MEPLRLVCYLTGPAQRLKDLVLLANLLGSEGISCFLPCMNHFQDMFAKRTPEEWISHNIGILHKCDFVFRLEGESKEADDEVTIASDHDKPIFYQYKALVTYLAEFGE